MLLASAASLGDFRLDLFNTATAAEKAANTGKTHEERASDWRRWQEFTQQFGLGSDQYLEAFSPLARQAIFGAFASFVRKAMYSGSRSSQVSSKQVRRTIGHVSQNFRMAGRPNPTLDVDGKLCIRLERIFKGFGNLDPKKKPQKAVPLKVLLEMLRRAKASSSPLDLAIARLAIGAYVFAMRSCEYSKTCSDEESKRTKVLRIRNIRFFLGSRLLSHLDRRIFIADYVNITFEWQKNDERDESISMHRYQKAKPREFDPVFIWATIVTNVRALPCTIPVEDRKVNFYAAGKQTREISSYQVRTKLRAAVVSIGEASLGFIASDIGCHSLRSGAAMAMKLAGISEFTIMIIGRWKSMAFLDYIRKQVAQFSLNLSGRMLTHANFFTTPDFHSALSSPSITRDSFAGGASDRGFSKSVQLKVGSSLLTV